MGLSDLNIFWYALIQNKELQLILMYMFPIKPSIVSKMAHFHKNVGVLKYFAPDISIRCKILNRRTSLKGSFSGTIWVPRENIKMKNEMKCGGSKPQTGLCAKYIDCQNFCIRTVIEFFQVFSCILVSLCVCILSLCILKAYLFHLTRSCVHSDPEW